MAANPTANNKTANPPARKITAYDLVIGLLAIFSLIILIPIYFGNLSQTDKDVLIIVEDSLCAIFLFDFFRSLRLAQISKHIMMRSGGLSSLLQQLATVITIQLQLWDNRWLSS